MAREPITSMADWPSLTFEGNLITAARVEKISNPNDDIATRESYRIRKGLTVRDEISTAFRVGQRHFDDFDKNRNKSLKATQHFVQDFLKETFDFDDLEKGKDAVSFVGGGRVPIVVVPPSDENLDRHSRALSVNRFHSPALILQDYLNEHDDVLWGLVTNGVLMRLMRHNTSLTRPAYIEVDLTQALQNKDTASFAAWWLMIHRSRFGAAGTPATDCHLERWREDGVREGEVARDKLAGKVRQALKILGSGFLEANPDLAGRIKRNEIDIKAWFNELLRLVYRLIFLMVAEDRNLLHPEGAKPEARRLYEEGYSLKVLRDQCYRATTWDKHFDRFEGVKVVFRSLARGESRLGLPPLGGLFSEDKLPNLWGTRLRNRALMESLYHLSFLDGDKTGKVRVNWRLMETEELGSVYESLLELQPQTVDDGKSLTFASEASEQRGNQRKITGSYYTPDSLVQALLDTTLEPVLKERLVDRRGGGGGYKDSVESLLNLSVIDPACGSGHFLLAVARRIATYVVRARCEQGDEVRSPSAIDFRHALREVSRRCIYGVDKNPMAVELTKVALWIETVDPGLPLGFFDSQIKCGDSLLGVFEIDNLYETGIPDGAYKPFMGDDKIVARDYLRANRDSRGRQGGLDFASGTSKSSQTSLAEGFASLRNWPERKVEEIDAKKHRYEELRKDEEFVRSYKAADLYIGAFLLPKMESGLGASARSVPISEDICMMFDKGECGPLLEKGIDAARDARAFHWKMEFPDVMGRGGFDVVIGNPPWEKFTVLAREFFSNIEEIADEVNAAKRDKAIERELERSPELAQDWNDARRISAARGEFARSSGRFPKTAVGELNLYPLFAELGISIMKESGWMGMVLKSLMFTGSTWQAFTDSLISDGRLHSVFDFRNSEMLFSSVDSNERFSLATMGPAQPESHIQLAVGLTNPLQLSSDNETESVIVVDREFPRRVNPETGTLPQCETLKDLRILSRMADNLCTLGRSDWNARYSRGLDMTINAPEMRDFETLKKEGFNLQGSWFVREDGEKKEYAPVYEGKLIHQYDHRFATFAGVSTKKRFGINAATVNPTEEQKTSRDFEILPRYWVSRSSFEENTSTRKINSNWNFAFRDTTNVASNFRTAVGCIVGPTAFNYKCPNLVIEKGEAVTSALFLSLFNSVPYDYLLRQKFYGANLTKSMLMQSFVVDKKSVMPYASNLLDAVASLTNTSDSVKGFCEAIKRSDLSVSDQKERLDIRAWIDALYFHLFGFEANEIDYVFETFKIWKNKSTETWGCFLEKDRAIALFFELESNLKK